MRSAIDQSAIVLINRKTKTERGETAVVPVFSRVPGMRLHHPEGQCAMQGEATRVTKTRHTKGCPLIAKWCRGRCPAETLQFTRGITFHYTLRFHYRGIAGEAPRSRELGVKVITSTVQPYAGRGTHSAEGHRAQGHFRR